MFISQEKENQLIDSLLVRVEEKVLGLENFKPLKTVIFNVGPDYSSIVAMRLAHTLSKDGEMSHLVPLDIAYPDDNQEKKNTFLSMSKGLIELMVKAKTIELFILCEAAVVTGNTFHTFYDRLTSLGVTKEQIISVALFEDNKSSFKSDFVGEHLDTLPEFWWEKPNKHWD